MALLKKSETKQAKYLLDNQDYNLAEIDYVNGFAVSTIAKKYDKPIGTVKNWRTTYGWDEKRAKQNEKLSERLFEANAKRACDTMSCGLQIAQELIELVREGIFHLKEITTDEPVVIKHSKKFGELARHALTASSVYRNYTFEIGADMSEKLVKLAEESVRRLREETKQEEMKELNATTTS